MIAMIMVGEDLFFVGEDLFLFLLVLLAELVWGELLSYYFGSSKTKTTI